MLQPVVASDDALLAVSNLRMYFPFTRGFLVHNLDRDLIRGASGGTVRVRVDARLRTRRHIGNFRRFIRTISGPVRVHGGHRSIVPRTIDHHRPPPTEADCLLWVA